MKPIYLYFVLAFCFCQTFTVIGKTPVISTKQGIAPPPRIIRTCCSFGSELRLAVIPGVKVTHIGSIIKMGPHKYLGDGKEGNGIIYTKKGGFIDLGHLRDLADWTAYLYTVIRQNQGKGEVHHKLGHEGGYKTLTLNIPTHLDSSDAIILAGRIAYDLSIWHEIATWFGASYIPMVTERYSSFSIEDAYSNLLGVTLGMQALQSELPYEEAMTQLLSSTMSNLNAVATEADTYAAMETVRDIWWTREKKIPSANVLLQRQLNVYEKVAPMRVPGLEEGSLEAFTLHVPGKTKNGEFLSDYYQLIIKPNYKVPFREMFPEQSRRFVTQKDFETVIQHVSKEWQSIQLHPGNYLPAKNDKKISLLH